MQILEPSAAHLMSLTTLLFLQDQQLNVAAAYVCQQCESQRLQAASKSRLPVVDHLLKPKAFVEGPDNDETIGVAGGQLVVLFVPCCHHNAVCVPLQSLICIEALTTCWGCICNSLRIFQFEHLCTTVHLESALPTKNGSVSAAVTAVRPAVDNRVTSYLAGVNISGSITDVTRQQQQWMLYLEHALLTATGDPALLSVPRDAFQLRVVWYGNLFAAKKMRTHS